VSLRDAALVEPMVTTLQGIARADPQPGESALVVGAGTLALMGAMLLSARGLRTHVLVRNPLRLEAVEAAGGIPWPAGEASPVKDGFDVVIEAAGSPDGVRAALDSAASGARVSVLGVPVADVEIDIARLVTRDITVHGILNGPGQFETGLAAIADGIVRPDLIIDRIYPFEEIEAAIARSQVRERARPKVLVQVDPDVPEAGTDAVS
jgi:threonine dehydrogenase-like Zn-dependent dehydrogenase